MRLCAKVKRLYADCFRHQINLFFKVDEKRNEKKMKKRLDKRNEMRI